MAAEGKGKELAVATNKKSPTTLDIQTTLDQKVLDTPRTQEACRRLGFTLEDLAIRSYESFAVPGEAKAKVGGDMNAKQQMRFQHYEKKRKDRYAQVLAERAKVIAQNSKKGEVPGVQSAQFLSMLESLFEKEAKRLEVDLKGQLRQHGSLVKENEEQLNKESELQKRLIKQEEARIRAQQQYEENGLKVKEKQGNRHAKHHEIVAKLDDDFEKKQREFINEVVAEEERLARFQEAKAQESSDKALIFKGKVEGMKKKTEEMIIKRRLEGEQKLAQIGQKIAQVEARREGEQASRMMLSEEQHLHIMDVRENKNRLERREGHRREELREQIDGNVERIETLLALKDQLLDQRRARNIKAEATKGSRGLNLRRDCLPGPGQYEAPATDDGKGVKIGIAKVPGMVDDAIKGTAANPAPGCYDVMVMANGDRVDKGGNGGKFGDREKISFLDEAQKAKEFVPAPGRYNSLSTLDARAPKMSRPRIDDAKQMPAWAKAAADTPGPAGYSVDEYTRKEVLRRAQRSLPNLTRDMLRPGKMTTA